MECFLRPLDVGGWLWYHIKVSTTSSSIPKRPQSSTSMKPIIKYQGGKTKELPLIKKMLPPNITAVIEPFCGGAAVSWALNKPAVLNDINEDLINLYKVVKDSNTFQFDMLLGAVNNLKDKEHDDLEKEYYNARDMLNQGTGLPLDRALAYIIVRQLCFSGMERYNSKGEFNVPFGHYKKFSCNLSEQHHLMMQSWQIHKCDFQYMFKFAHPTDLIFIDPPYIDRLGYTGGDGGDELHERLVEEMKTTKAKWMFIHSDHEFYREELKDFVWYEQDFGYSQRFGKDRDHSNAAVKHIYVTNYEHGFAKTPQLPI